MSFMGDAYCEGLSYDRITCGKFDGDQQGVTLHESASTDRGAVNLIRLISHADSISIQYCLHIPNVHCII